MLVLLKKLGYTYSDILDLVDKVEVVRVPEIGEDYYFINERMEVESICNEGYDINTMTIEVDNYFFTKEEAMSKAKELKEILSKDI